MSYFLIVATTFLSDTINLDYVILSSIDRHWSWGLTIDFGFNGAKDVVIGCVITGFNILAYAKDGNSFRGSGAFIDYYFFYSRGVLDIGILSIFIVEGFA